MSIFNQSRYVPERPRDIAPLFSWFDQSLLDLQREVNLERLIDAAVETANQQRKKLCYDPVEWGEDDGGHLYGLLVKPLGLQEHQGLFGQAFGIRCRSLIPRRTAKRRRH